MARRSPVIPKLADAVIFIILEVAASYLLIRNSELQKLWVARAAHGVVGTVWGGTESVRDYFSLKRQNDALAAENFELRKALLDQHDAAPRDTMVRRDGGYSYLYADVVKISNNKQHNYLIIDKGSEDGVTDQCGIITGKGIVGIVDAVSKHYSYALSFRNSDVSISARLGEEGAVGPLVWDGRSYDQAILKEIPLQYKYEPGDTVFTSGYSSIFPPDIPLGIAGESKVINGATNEIRITLFQDFAAVRHVTVVRNWNRAEVEGLQP